MSLTYKDVTEILRIIDESDVEELILEVGDSKIEIRRHGTAGTRQTAAIPAPQPTAEVPPSPQPKDPSPAPPAAKPSAKATAAGTQVRAPMVGTFYRRPAPQKPAYVEIGDAVQQGDPICIIEVMKLFTTIEAPVTGRVVEIGAENEDLVQLDQLLFVIEPV